MSLDEIVRERSREFALLCDADGTIRWADDRAKRHLELSKVLTRLHDHADAASRPIVDAFLAASLHNETIDYKAVLRLRSGNLPVRLQGEPHDSGVLIVATIAVNGEIAAMRAELAESRRAVLTLYDELEQKAAGLHRSAEVRSRVLSTVRHDFRTRLQSIHGLTALLLDRVDGPLTAEQDKQIRYIRSAAALLGQQAEEILDLSTSSVTDVTLRVRPFEAAQLIAGVRGMIRPLSRSNDVRVVVDDPPADLELLTDEGKLAEILRHLIGNALKFTDRGEVRLSIRVAGDLVVFEVRDTGVGISAADKEHVFEEFAQIGAERRARGTGLGLPLSRRLAIMLGGDLMADSEPGVGSAFTLRIPRRHPEFAEVAKLESRAVALDPTRIPIMVVEDDGHTLLVYERLLAGSGFQLVAARNLEGARKVLERVRPAAIILDVILEGESSWSLLQELKSNPDTRDIPVLVVTVTNREQKARELGADAFFLKPIDQSWLLKELRATARFKPVETVLMIDDDEVSLYLMRRLLEGSPYELLEAQSGDEGYRLAKSKKPGMIFLDFILGGGLTAFDVLEKLNADPETRDIPVVIVTSKELTADDRAELARRTTALVSKQLLSRELAISRIRETLRH